jgi:predicted nucleic acid-binding protein
MPLKVFIDTDVLITSLISKTGASYFLIKKTNVKLVASNFSKDEAYRVVKRLNLSKTSLDKTLKNRFSSTTIKEPMKKVKTKYQKYVLDINDAHIVAGAKEAQAKFLITYNIKHFDVEKIKNDLKILVMRPAQFLQYTRSQK